MEYRRLATVETKPEGRIILFIHFNEAGKLKGAEYIIAGESKEVLVGMSEKFLQLIQGFKCEEAVEYPSTIVIPIAILPDPYFEYYQDPELKSEKTIYQLDPGLAQLLYDLRRSEAFYVWDIYRFPMRYRKAED